MEIKHALFAVLLLVLSHSIQPLYAQQPDTARAWRWLEEAAALAGTGALDSAMALVDSAALHFPEGEGVTPAIAEEVEAFGRFFFGNSRFWHTRRCFLYALGFFRKLYGETGPNVDRLLQNLGVASVRLGEPEEALSYFLRSLEQKQQLYDTATLDLAKTYNNLGVTYSDLGRLNEALENYDKALEIKQRLAQDDGGAIVSTLLNLGALHFEKKDVVNGERALLEAKAMAERYLGPESEELAKIYNNLGAIASYVGDYKKAVGLHTAALEIKIKANGPESLEVAESYDNLGATYYESGNLEKGLEMIEKAREIKERILENPGHYSFGVSYNHLGTVHVLQGYFPEAIENLSLAAGYQSEGHYNLIDIYLNMAFAYYKMADMPSSDAFYRKALKLARHYQGAKSPDAVKIYVHLAVNRRAQREEDRALELLDSAFLASGYRQHPGDWAQAVGHYELLQAMADRADILNSQAENPAAPVQVEAVWEGLAGARDLEAYIRQSFQEEDSKARFLELSVQVYEQVLRAGNHPDIRQKYQRELFEMAERSKSVLLYESMRESRARRFGDVPQEALDEEYAMRVEINYLTKRLYQEEQNENDSLRLAVNRELLSLKERYRQFIRKLEKDYPDYYKLKFNDAVVSADYVRDSLLEEGQGLLEFVVGDSSLFIFLVTRDNYQVKQLRKDFPLEAWVDSLRHSIYENPDDDESVNRYIHFARLLYDTLLGPVAAGLPNRLVIIPDGVLSYLPFEALLTKAPEDTLMMQAFPYLLKEKQISYCYSATLLREMKEKDYSQIPREELLAVAPFYDGSLDGLDAYYPGTPSDDDNTKPGGEEEEKLYKPLKSSGEEVYELRKLWGGGDAYFGEDATEALFDSLAGSYRLLHLSTHGIADERVGDFSYLVFHVINDGKENELLYVRDIYNLRLQADMAVLSACQTNLGQLRRGEGVISLARAFAYAGSRSIVTTLWNVKDRATKQLSLDYYRFLREGLPKDEALQKAKLEQVKDYFKAHPYHWAGLIAVGDMGKLK